MLSVPVFSTVGVHHPAHVWAQQGSGRVQQWLHQRCWAAVDSYSNQLRGSVSHLHGVCERAAVRYTLPILTVFVDKTWVVLTHCTTVNNEWTLVILFISNDYLTREGEPGFRVWELLEQLNQSLRLFDTWDCLKSNEVRSRCCYTVDLRPMPNFKLLGREKKTPETIDYDLILNQSKVLVLNPKSNRNVPKSEEKVAHLKFPSWGGQNIVIWLV